MSMGELYRLLAAQSKTLGDIQAGIEARPKWVDIDRLEKARDLREEIQDQAIKDLEDNGKWQVRTIGAALVGAVGAILLAAAPFVNR